MINKRIYELDSFTGITGNNYLLVDDSSLTSSKKISIDNLKTYVLSGGSYGTSGTSGTNGVDGTSGSSGTNGASGSVALSAGTFTQTLTFESSKYYSSYDQWENVVFAATSGGTNVPLNVVYMQINLNRLYTVTFGTNFEMNRNDIDGNNGAYDFWFVYKPNGKVAYSIVKTGTYQPIAILPYSGNTVARYSASNITTDPTSGKVTKIVNTYNDLLSLYSNTDATRPILDLTNNRLVFNSTGKTENLSGGTITFVSGTSWYVGCLIQLDPSFGQTMVLFRSGNTGASTNTLVLGDKDTSYLNGLLTTQTAASGIHNKLAGVHILGWNQTSGASELYLDDTLILSGTKTGLTLSLSNVLSTYVNTTTSSASRIKYLYDMIIYNRNMNSTERSAISSFFKTNYSQFDPTNGPTITSYQTSGITSGMTLYTGNTINVTYTVTSVGTVATNLIIVWKSGGGTLQGMSVSDSPTSVTIPSGIAKTTQYWTTGYILDQYGRASNAIDYSGTGTRFTIA